MDLIEIFKRLGRLSPIDPGRWESFPCGRGFRAALSAYNFAGGATLSILKRSKSWGVVSTICVCTPYSKDVPVLYLRHDSNRFGDKLSIYTFDTCSCKCSNLSNLDKVVNRFNPLLNLVKTHFPPDTEYLSCSVGKFSLKAMGCSMIFELLKDFLSCYADMLSSRPSYCNPEQGDNTIVDKQQNLVDKLFFMGDFVGKRLFRGMDIPNYEDFIDFLHFSAVPHLKISKSMLV